MLCRDCFSENNLTFYILPVGALMLKNVTLGIKMVEQTALTTTMMKGQFSFFFYRDSRKSNIDMSSTKKSCNEWVRKKLKVYGFSKKSRKVNYTVLEWYWKLQKILLHFGFIFQDESSFKFNFRNANDCLCLLWQESGISMCYKPLLQNRK